MTRLEIASWCSLAALAAISTTASAAPKKPKKPAGAAPAASASAAPADSSAAPASAPSAAPSAAPTAVGDDDEASAHASAAPDEGDKKIAIGADLLFVLPVGNLSDVSGPQIGPLLHVGYRIIPPLELTGRIGYLFALGKSQNVGSGNSASASVSDLPVWLGARYFLQEAPAGLYAAAEIGMNFLNASASGTINGQNVSSSNGDTRFGFNLGVGYVFSKDLPIDVRLQYSYMNLIGANGEGALMGFGLSAGYSFFL